MINLGIVSSKQRPKIRGGSISSINIYEKNFLGFFVNNTYTIHAFNTSENILIDCGGEFDYLIIAGGGGGGTNGGGGGAGGFIEARQSFINSGPYPIVIGSGGAVGSNGSPSTFLSISSTGGGAGGSNSVSVSFPGGSGGGAGWGPAAGELLGSTGISQQGFSGGKGSSNTYLTDPANPKSTTVVKGAGGGGGGAGIDGTPYSGTQTDIGGNGGIGKISSITGSNIYYSGGGAAYGYTTNGSAGLGGGGAVGSAGQNNTGGGGGANAAGGPGVVIIRYK